MVFKKRRDWVVIVAMREETAKISDALAVADTKAKASMLRQRHWDEVF
jgi:hypothetical protein